MGDREITKNYAFSIAEELRALEQLLNGEDAGTCMGCDYDRYGCQCDHFEPGSPEMVELFESMRSTAGDGDDYAPNLVDYLNGECLDWTVLGERSNGDDWTVTGARICRTLGGPNCFIEWQDGQTSLLVTVKWGGESADQRVYAPITAAAIGELAES
jgi:hypothetical protein